MKKEDDFRCLQHIKKMTKETKKEPEITLVGEFRKRRVYIGGSVEEAAEFSEYLKFGLEAIQFFEKLDPEIILELNKKHDARSNRKAKSTKKSVRSKS